MDSIFVLPEFFAEEHLPLMAEPTGKTNNQMMYSQSIHNS